MENIFIAILNNLSSKFRSLYHLRLKVILVVDDFFLVRRDERNCDRRLAAIKREQDGPADHDVHGFAFQTGRLEMAGTQGRIYRTPNRESDRSHLI